MPKRAAQTSEGPSPKRTRTIKSPHDHAHELDTKGVTVFSLGFSVTFLALLQLWACQEIAAYPEFKGDATEFVGGGFQAHGNAGSFHNPMVRWLRWYLHVAATPIYRALANTLGYTFIQMIPDRLMLRVKGRAATAETFHRDEAKGLPENALAFGGWFNFSTNSVYFRCVPATHRTSQGIIKGFVKVRDPKLYKGKDKLVEIPPGHMIIFQENLVHAVNGTKNKFDQYRLFTSAILSHSPNPFDPMVFTHTIPNQAPFTLKSGQISAMIPKLWLVNHTEKVKVFAPMLHDRCTYEHEFKSGKKKGLKMRAPLRLCPSLQELGAKYEDYTQEEIRRYMPLSLDDPLLDQYPECPNSMLA